MNLHDLSPFPVYVDWEGEPVELKPFDLRAMTWAERFFFKDGVSGMDRMNQLLSNTKDQTALQNTVVDIIYHLGEQDFKKIGFQNAVELKKEVFNVVDFADFDRVIDTVDQYRVSLYESFDYDRAEQIELAIKRALEFRNKPRKNHIEKVSEFKTALEQVIKNSFGEQKKEEEQTGGAIFQMLKAREKAQKVKQQQNWDQIYTVFFLASGISIDDFYKLTIKQINAIMPEISYNKSKDVEIQCDIHKIPLKKRVRRKEQAETFSDEEITKFDKVHQELMRGNRIN